MDDTTLLVKVMFWTVLAIMLVILYMLSMVNKTQRHIENMDRNIEKLVRRTLIDEERILNDIEESSSSKKRKK